MVLSLASLTLNDPDRPGCVSIIFELIGHGIHRRWTLPAANLMNDPQAALLFAAINIFWRAIS